MDYGTFIPEKIHILRIDPGEDVLSSIKQFLTEKKINQAVVLGGYGTLASYSLHWVTHNKIPTDNKFETGEGGIEILSMNGLVVQGEPHIHISLAKDTGAFGGHLEPGAKAYVICEVFFAEISGFELSRQKVDIDVKNMGSGKISRLFFGKD